MTGRDRLVFIVLGAAAVLAGFWFLALAPKRKEAADVRAKVAVQEARLVKARGAVTAAEGAKERYDADYAAVAALGQAVPADDDVPSLIVQVNRAADREHVDFRSLALDASGAASSSPAPSAPAQAQGAAATAPATGTDSGKSDSGSAPPAAPAAPAQATTATLPPGASVGPAGFPTMPFTFEFVGSFFRLEDFLGRLNAFTNVHGNGDLSVHGRLLSVDSFDLKAAPSGFPRVSASVHATAFVLPPGQGLTAGATADGPAAAGGSGADGAPAGGGSGGSPAPTAAASLMTGGRR